MAERQTELKEKFKFFFHGRRKNPPLILVCNDDGILSDGITVLAESMRDLGDVLVVAPKDPKSAMSHAMTMGVPLRIEGVSKGKKFFGYGISGTSVDSIKVSLSYIAPRQPNLIVSGINHGSNTSANTLYSSTVAAAMEGALVGIPAIAFSVCTYKQTNFSFAKSITKKISRMVLLKGLPLGTILNVNIPNLPLSQIKGYQVTSQGSSRWTESLVARTDSFGQKYYWIQGDFQLHDTELTQDEYAVRKGYISITPLQTNLTNETCKSYLKSWKMN